MAAFRWLDEQVQIHGDDLPRSLLAWGFVFNNHRITLVGPVGIWKPRILERVPLSITAVVGGPYDDVFTKDGFLEYRYRGTDINHRDNVGLREAMQRQIPLTYFQGVKGRYLAVWPVFVIGDNPGALSFTLAADDPKSIERYINGSSVDDSSVAEESTYYKRSYITATIRIRLHQKSFRERVLDAYNGQCTFCKLKHLELLDAAHIVPDVEESGEPTVNNGLSLCIIHHAAFDSNIIGVTPDYKIEARKDVLAERDGPMLRYGIQQLHERGIILPRHRPQWPDQEKLARRFEKFTKAG